MIVMLRHPSFGSTQSTRNDDCNEDGSAQQEPSAVNETTTRTAQPMMMMMSTTTTTATTDPSQSVAVSRRSSGPGLNNRPQATPARLTQAFPDSSFQLSTTSPPLALPYQLRHHGASYATRTQHPSPSSLLPAQVMDDSFSLRNHRPFLHPGVEPYRDVGKITQEDKPPSPDPIGPSTLRKVVRQVHVSDSDSLVVNKGIILECLDPLRGNRKRQQEYDTHDGNQQWFEDGVMSGMDKVESCMADTFVSPSLRAAPFGSASRNVPWTGGPNTLAPSLDPQESRNNASQVYQTHAGLNDSLDATPLFVDRSSGGNPEALDIAPLPATSAPNLAHQQPISHAANGNVAEMPNRKRRRLTSSSRASRTARNDASLPSPSAAARADAAVSSPTAVLSSMFPTEAGGLNRKIPASGSLVASRNTAAITGGTGSNSSGEESGDGNVDFRGYQTALWDKRFCELLDFRQAHGNCLVPHNWKVNPSLAKWVKRQRYQYKLKKEDKHSTLTDEREQALDDLGFIWDSHRAVWEERLSELLQFRRMHGHCNVPSTYNENHSLSIWVQCQRRQYKLYKEKGKRSHMSQERIDRLESIGFIWRPRDRTGGATKSGGSGSGDTPSGTPPGKKSPNDSQQEL